MRALRLFAFAEGVSLLLLVGVAAPLKHLFGHSVAVRALGPLHGLAFLAYAVCVLDALGTHRLTRRQAGLALVAAMIPGGTFFFARTITRLAAQHGTAASAAPNHERDVRAPRPALDEVTDVVAPKNVDERTR